MGIARLPSQVKLVVAIMFRSEPEARWAQSELVARFGPTDFTHGPIPFEFTTYYEKEMGPRLSKTFLAFATPVDRGDLPAIKTFTNAIEQRRLDAAGGRTVNLDPGYLSNDKLVLATTKDFYHRIHLLDGIYGEVTLHFRQGCWRHFSWTYADYRDPGVQRMLEKARAKLVGETRKNVSTESR